MDARVRLAAAGAQPALLEELASTAARSFADSAESALANELLSAHERLSAAHSTFAARVSAAVSDERLGGLGRAAAGLLAALEVSSVAGSRSAEALRAHVEAREILDAEERAAVQRTPTPLWQHPLETDQDRGLTEADPEVDAALEAAAEAFTRSLATEQPAVDDTPSLTSPIEPPHEPQQPTSSRLAPLSPLPGSAFDRVLARLQRCPGDACAQELGLLALSSFALAPASPGTSAPSRRWVLDGTRVCVDAARAHGAEHAAVAVAACEAGSALLRATRALGGAHLDAALAELDTAGCCAAVMRSHPADAAVARSALDWLLRMASPAPLRERGVAQLRAKNVGLARCAQSEACEAAVDAMWAHPACARIQALAAALCALLCDDCGGRMLAKGIATALTAAARRFSGGSAVAAACEAIWRLLTSAHAEAAGAALRFCGAEDALRALVQDTDGGEVASVALRCLLAPPLAQQPPPPANDARVTTSTVAPVVGAMLSEGRVEVRRLSTPLPPPSRSAALLTALQEQEAAAAALAAQMAATDVMLQGVGLEEKERSM